MSAFNVNNPFWQFMNKMADQFLLSLLWLLCSLPIITYGASTTAFVTSSMKLHRNCESSITKDFFSTFKKSFGRASTMWLMHIFIDILLAADFWICWNMRTKAGAFMLPVLLVLGILVFIASCYTWPLLSHTDSGMIRVWKTAMHLTVSFLPHSLSMLILVVIGAAVSFFSPGLIILVPFIVCYQYARVYAWTFVRDPFTRELLNESAQYCISSAECAENISDQDKNKMEEPK